MKLLNLNSNSCGNTILLILTFFSLSLGLSSCELMMSRQPEEGQRQIFFTCAGTTTVILRDYCVTNTSSQVKLLIANMNLNDITTVDIEIMGTQGDFEIQERLSLEMEETILVTVDLPESIGVPIDISIRPNFLSGRGIESCNREMILFDSIRQCSG